MGNFRVERMKQHSGEQTRRIQEARIVLQGSVPSVWEGQW